MLRASSRRGRRASTTASSPHACASASAHTYALIHSCNPSTPFQAPRRALGEPAVVRFSVQQVRRPLSLRAVRLARRPPSLRHGRTEAKPLQPLLGPLPEVHAKPLHRGPCWRSSAGAQAWPRRRGRGPGDEGLTGRFDLSKAWPRRRGRGLVEKGVHGSKGAGVTHGPGHCRTCKDTVHYVLNES